MTTPFDSPPPSNDVDEVLLRRLVAFGRRLLASAFLARNAPPRPPSLVPRETPPFVPTPDDRARWLALSAAAFDAMAAEDNPFHTLDPASLLIDPNDPLLLFVPDELLGSGPPSGRQENELAAIREIEDGKPPESRARPRRPSSEPS